MYDIEVSNFNNNSGLYAIALIAKWKSENSATTNLPGFLGEIVAKDLVQEGSDIETKSILGQILRVNLGYALESDATYKESCFRDFVSLCVQSPKKIPAHMEPFIHSNAEFIFRTNSDIQKINKGELFSLKGMRLDAYSYAYIESKAQWDTIYNNYVSYITGGTFMPSTKELACLAANWGLNLCVKELGKAVTEPLMDNFDFAIENKTGKQWRIIANDSTLTPASAKIDDQFKTLCVMDELLTETLQAYKSILAPTEKSTVAAFRMYYRSCITKTGELIIVPLNRLSSLSFNGIVDSKEFTVMKLRDTSYETLWSFKRQQKVYTTGPAKSLGMGLAASILLDGASIAAGVAGAEEAILFTRAFQIGNAARLGEAINIGEAIFSVTNIAILVSVISFELAMLARRKYNEFNDVIREALILYQETLEEPNNKDKLSKIDQMLRSEVGLSEYNRWMASRSVIWMQTKAYEKFSYDSDDAYSLIYFILADIGSKLGHKDMKELFKRAYASNNAKIKGLSILELTKLLIKEYEADPTHNSSHKNKSVRNNMAALGEICPEIVLGCFNDVHNALAYTLWVVKTQTAKDALLNIEKILRNSQLPLLPYMEPHGPLYTAILLFVQGICLELQSKVTIEENLQKSTPDEKKINDGTEIRKKFGEEVLRKFKYCCEVMLDFEKTKDPSADDHKKKIAFLAQMRCYVRRYVEEANENGDIDENVQELINKYNLEEEVDSCNSDAEFIEMHKRQQVAKANLSV